MSNQEFTTSAQNEELTAPETVTDEQTAPEAATEEQKTPEPKKDKKQGKVKKALKSRRLRHGTVAAAITAVVIAAVIVLNVIAGLLVDRFPNLKADFTSNSAYALQNDTKEYMKNLNKDVTLYILSTKTAFENNGEYFVQAKNLLEKMVQESNGKLKVVYKDTASDPNFTKKYKNIDWTSATNVAVIECGEQYKALSLNDCFTYDEEYAAQGMYQYTGTTIEQAVVKGALYVTTEDKVVVDVIKDNQPGDYSGVTALLNDNAYTVNEVSLITGEISKDALFVVLFAPQADLDSSQIEKLSKWLDNGGKLGKNLIYVASSQPVDTPNINSFLNSWGMKINSGFVFETDPNHLQTGANPYTFIADYNQKYVENLKNPNIPVVVNYAHGIEITDDSAASALLNTSDRAGTEPVDHDENWDYNSAITGNPIAIAAEGVKTEGDSASRVITFSSDRMLLNAFMQYNSFNNAGYLMNIFNTLAEKDDDTVVIEGKSLENAELGITDVSSTAFVMVIFVIIIPLGVIILGIVLWVLRRNK